MKIHIENVRCFDGHHVIPIRPLTFLVGENSAGKSTLLATLNLLTDSKAFPMTPDFNQAPYNLGEFDTIATYKGGRYGRAPFFSIGHEVIKNKVSKSLIATYSSDQGVSQLSKISYKSEKYDVTFSFKDKSNYNISIKHGGKRRRFSSSLANLPSPDNATFHDLIIFSLVSSKNEDRYDLANKILDDLQGVRINNSLSVAPIRTNPERTYDRISEKYKPAGDHIPYLLAKTLADPNNPKKEELEESLLKFGIDSGLFSDVKIKKLGRKNSDPFQVIVKIAGQYVNLIDVGYGVSQSLPVVIESVVSKKANYFLMQQPEVHLHPRAQAALGSFFSNLVSKESKKFVIETHSDFIIDRVRQNVANGTIDKNKVQILFFDKKYYETTVYQIKLDGDGNIINPPSTFRKFFLDEEMRLLTRGA